MMNQFIIYETDTEVSLRSKSLEREEWRLFLSVASYDTRRPLSYAVRKGLDAAIEAAYNLARLQNVTIIRYQGCDPPIEDDGSILAAIQAIRKLYYARAVQLLGQAIADIHSCSCMRKGWRNPGELCPSCGYDDR